MSDAWRQRLPPLVIGGDRTYVFSCDGVDPTGYALKFRLLPPGTSPIEITSPTITVSYTGGKGVITAPVPRADSSTLPEGDMPWQLIRTDPGFVWLLADGYVKAVQPADPIP